MNWLRPLDVEFGNLKVTGLDTLFVGALIALGLSFIPVLNLPNGLNLSNPLPTDARSFMLWLGIVILVVWGAGKLFRENGN
jgi:hypothetical protein